VAIDEMSINGFTINGRSYLKKIWDNLLPPVEQPEPPAPTPGASTGAFYYTKFPEFGKDYQKLWKPEEYLVFKFKLGGKDYRFDTVVLHNLEQPEIIVSGINTYNLKVNITNLRKLA
jgi:hypothetical protein